MIEVRPAAGPHEVWAALDLRREVFVDEQGVSIEEDRDGRDDEAVHLVAFTEGAMVGTCRLLAEGAKVKLARMVVSRRARGQGIAGLLLAEADTRARELGAARIVLGAQVAARGVYERAGYEAYGDVFDDAGIDHVMMGKDVA